MLGFTRTGCFFTGIVMGFILALALTLFVLFQCDPGVRDSVRRIWGSVREGVDSTLDAPPKPGAHRPREPQIPKVGPAVKEVPAPHREKGQVPHRPGDPAPPRTGIGPRS